MIDALDAQSAPITRELRLYERRQPGCRALMKHYGIGRADRGHDPRRARQRTALLLLAPRRAGHHRPPVRPAPHRRAPLAPGAAGAALGALRGRPGRATNRSPRPHTLHRTDPTVLIIHTPIEYSQPARSRRSKTFVFQNPESARSSLTPVAPARLTRDRSSQKRNIP